MSIDMATSGVASGVERLAEDLKPRLRGQLHLVMAPLAAVAGAVLVLLASGTPAKLACGAFALGAVLLFTVSAAYHTRTWSEPARRLMRRWDHANIFVLIAASYTPFAVLMLPAVSARELLGVVWSGALVGAVAQVCWAGAPRWLYVPVYVALGWAAVFWAGGFLAAGTPAVLGLIALGGLLYTAGAVVYGRKRPDLAPGWFGFHELFHALTIAAFTAHCVGVWLLLG